MNILDDTDFQQLGDRPKLLLFALKLSLGPLGFGVFRKLVLCEQLSWSVQELEETLTVLEGAKPGRSQGWIIRGGNRLWLVNGLRFEPQLAPTNVRHRSFVQSRLQPLEGGPLVDEFRAYYAEWFDGNVQATGSDQGIQAPSDRPSKANRMAIDSLSAEGFPMAIATPSDTRTRSTDTADGTQNTIHEIRDTATVTERFLDHFYRGAGAERRLDVRHTLTASLSPRGARVKRGEFVFARDANHLDECLLAVIEDPPNDPDKAIVFVLRKLGDGGSPVRTRRKTAAEQSMENTRRALADLPR